MAGATPQSAAQHGPNGMPDGCVPYAIVRMHKARGVCEHSLTCVKTGQMGPIASGRGQSDNPYGPAVPVISMWPMINVSVLKFFNPTNGKSRD